MAQDETCSQRGFAVAIFDYEKDGSNDNDLEMREIITGLVQNESGWSHGQRRNGNHGWFPSAYVTMQVSGESSVSEAPKHVNNHGLKQSYFQGTLHKLKDAARPQEGLRKVWHTAMDPQRKKGANLAPFARPKLAISHLPEAVALYSYKAGEPNEISFPEDARIAILIS